MIKEIEEIKKIIELAILANGGDTHRKNWCQCDLSVNYFCEYCAIFNGLSEARTFLSSLEKEEQAHTMSVFDLNMKIAELGIALEKIQGDYQKIIKEVLLCDPISACNRPDDQLEPPWEVVARIRMKLKKEKEKCLRIVRGEFKQICSYCGWETPPPNGWEELQSHIRVCPKHPLVKAEERVKELETQLASIKADPSIGKLEIVDSFDDNDWP